VDINYGWGENIQLKPDCARRESGGAPTAGDLGPSLFGFTWRFFEHQKSELVLPLYPQWPTHLVRSSVDRGVVNPGGEWFLPVVAAIKVND
jgi:hypothetical protein